MAERRLPWRMGDRDGRRAWPACGVPPGSSVSVDWAGCEPMETSKPSPRPSAVRHRRHRFVADVSSPRDLGRGSSPWSSSSRPRCANRHALRPSASGARATAAARCTQLRRVERAPSSGWAGTSFSAWWWTRGAIAESVPRRGEACSMIWSRAFASYPKEHWSNAVYKGDGVERGVLGGPRAALCRSFRTCASSAIVITARRDYEVSKARLTSCSTKTNRPFCGFPRHRVTSTTTRWGRPKTNRGTRYTDLKKASSPCCLVEVSHRRPDQGEQGDLLSTRMKSDAGQHWADLDPTTRRGCASASRAMRRSTPKSCARWSKIFRSRRWWCWRSWWGASFLYYRWTRSIVGPGAAAALVATAFAFADSVAASAWA